MRSGPATAPAPSLRRSSRRRRAASSPVAAARERRSAACRAVPSAGLLPPPPAARASSCPVEAESRGWRLLSVRRGECSAPVVSVDGRPVRLQLCDTAGQDEFDKLRPLCYTNTDIFLLCFSVVSPSSFQNVSEKWVPEIRCHCPKAPIILVGTQSDLREDVKVLIELDKCKEKPVAEEAAMLCAEEIKAASYIECSALTQKNLKEVFDTAIVAGIQYSDTQHQPKKSKCRTPDKMKNLSKSWWKKYCCFV
ncbi:rho-related GTP-binding protein RhoU isoform X2 [Dermochelys coriacea]|uniref:rho-related GTP-binding protein RhoU isoform X2 n=1 Tax=Dermochelys coriacea TaxID=27794 RepID=UPI001CA821F0|nr:rho-related GTP-binding protein RhoU isoform X2 [Dermochelys coriacea]